MEKTADATQQELARRHCDPPRAHGQPDPDERQASGRTGGSGRIADLGTAEGATAGAGAAAVAPRQRAASRTPTERERGEPDASSRIRTNTAGESTHRRRQRAPGRQGQGRLRLRRASARHPGRHGLRACSRILEPGARLRRRRVGISGRPMERSRSDEANHF
eukprot:scaffold80_cov106-Isochrysis_galbana.AAC.3